MNYFEVLESVGEPDPVTGCREWTRARTAAGYGAVNWNGKVVLAHRLAYTRAVGPIQAGKFVCHRCDNPACVEPSHLFVGTQRDNMRDCAAKWRTNAPKGEACRSAKLTEIAVAEIRQRYAAWNRKCSLRKLASEFGVDHKTIFRIVSGRGWRTT